MRTMTMKKFYTEAEKVIKRMPESDGYMGIKVDLTKFNAEEEPTIKYEVWTRMKNGNYLRCDGETPKIAIDGIQVRYAELMKGPVELVF